MHQRMRRVVLFFVILYKTEASFLPPMEYDGDSWLVNWTHVQTKKSGIIVDEWQTPKFKIIYLKTPEWPDSLKANKEEWVLVERATEEMMSTIRQLVLQVRKRSKNVFIPRHCHDLKPGYHMRAQNCRTAQGETCSPKAWCYDLPVPDEHGDGCTENDDSKPKYEPGDGVDADILLYVSFQDCKDHLANAIPCQFDPQYRRPMAGRIAMCYSEIVDYMKKHRQMVNILMHEFFHILIAPMYGAMYLNPETKRSYDDSAYMLVERNWRSVEGDHKRNAFLSTLPTVLQVVREHFNCSTLEGAEMDNSSESSPHNPRPKDFAHLEMRLFPDALMSPIYLPGVELSKLDVAFVADSGWYQVNTSMGRRLSVTRGKGCDFATKSCYEYIESVNHDRTRMYPYCDKKDDGRWMCSLDHTHSAYCNGREKETGNVLRGFRLSTEENAFHGMYFTEYCPMVVPRHVVRGDSSPYCQENPTVDFRLFNAYGGSSDSRCVRYGDLEVTKKTGCPEVDETNVGVCVKKVNCTSDQILFEFGGRVQKCSFSQSGQKVDFDFQTVPNDCRMTGTFCCPDFETFCETGAAPVVRMDHCSGCRICNINLLLNLIMIGHFIRNKIYRS